MSIAFLMFAPGCSTIIPAMGVNVAAIDAFDAGERNTLSVHLPYSHTMWHMDVRGIHLLTDDDKEGLKRRNVIIVVKSTSDDVIYVRTLKALVGKTFDYPGETIQTYLNKGEDVIVFKGSLYDALIYSINPSINYRNSLNKDPLEFDVIFDVDAAIALSRPVRIRFVGTDFL